MANQVKKLMTCQVKEMPDRIMEFVGSCETPDRMGDRVHADGWQLDNYKKNPVFLWAHDYKQLPIGKAVAVSPADGKLMFKIEFATHPFAETVYQLYKGGFLNAVSVGFAPLDFSEYHEGDKGGYDYVKQELMELSACPVPAHPDALVTARTQGLITVKEFDAMSKRLPTQAEVRDEIDYLNLMIDEAGIAEVGKEKALELARKLLCQTGTEVKEMDMPMMKKCVKMMADCESMCADCQKMLTEMMEDGKMMRVTGGDMPDEDMYQRVINVIGNKIGGR